MVGLCIDGHILSAWKAFIENEEQEICEDVDIDSIFSGGDSQRLPKMCRKGFNAYKTYNTSHETILNKLKKTAEVLELFPLTQCSNPFQRGRGLVDLHLGKQLNISLPVRISHHSLDTVFRVLPRKKKSRVVFWLIMRSEHMPPPLSPPPPKPNTCDILVDSKNHL